MTKRLSDKIASLSPERQRKIERRVAYLVAEEQSLRDLRQALHLTQEQMAKSLNIRQENVCRIERRTDLLISTLRNFIHAMGGELHLVAQFRDRPPIELAGFAAMENERPKKA